MKFEQVNTKETTHLYAKCQVLVPQQKHDMT